MSTQTNEERAREQLIDLAAEFYDQFAGGQIPEMTLPTRTKSNIEYDKDSGVIELTSNVASLDEYLPDEDRREIPWQTIYLGLAIVGLAVYGIATAAQGTIPQGVLNVVGLLIFVTFGAVVTAQYLYERT